MRVTNAVCQDREVTTDCVGENEEVEFWDWNVFIQEVEKAQKLFVEE